MKTRFLLLLLALVLASCNLSNSQMPPDPDWCYEWDFRTGLHGFSISLGNLVDGRGIVTDENGNLNIHYSAGGSVTPNGLLVSVARAEESVMPINIYATISIFGTRFGTAQTTIDAGTNRAVLQRPMASTGTGIAIEGRATEPVQIELIRIQGEGENPFETSNCSSADSSYSPIDVPFADIFNQIQGADQSLAGYDLSLTAPNGTNLAPAASTLGTVFSYAKWIVAPTTANSLAGPFAPIIIEFGLLMAAEIALLAIYIGIYAVVYIIRWVVWIFKLILAIVEAVSSTIGGVVGFLFKFIGK